MENNETLNNAVKEAAVEVAKEAPAKIGFAQKHPYLATIGLAAGTGAAMMGSVYAVDWICKGVSAIGKGIRKRRQDRKARKAAEKNSVVVVEPKAEEKPEA